MQDKTTEAPRHLVVIPPGSVITDMGIDDSACEPHRHTRDVVIDRPAPFRDRVIVTANVGLAPALSAAFAGRPVPSPELGAPMPTAAPKTMYVVSLPYAAHDAEGAYLTREAAALAARRAVRELTPLVIFEVHDADDDRSSLVAGPVIARVDPMPVHDAPAHGLPVVGLDAVAAALDVGAVVAEVLASVDPDDTAQDPCPIPADAVYAVLVTHPGGRTEVLNRAVYEVGEDAEEAARSWAYRDSPERLESGGLVIECRSGRRLAVVTLGRVGPDPHDGMTNADIGEGLSYEDEQAAEFALDALDDERNAELAAADDVYDPAEDEPYQGLGYDAYDPYDPAGDRE